MNSDHKLEKIELVEIENGYRVFLRKNIVKSKNETNRGRPRLGAYNSGSASHRQH